MSTDKNLEELLLKIERREKKQRTNTVIIASFFILISCLWLVFVFLKVSQLNHRKAEILADYSILEVKKDSIQLKYDSISYLIDYMTQKYNIIKDSIFNVQASHSAILIGESLAKRGNYLGAISYYNDALKIDSSNPITYEYKGYSYYRLGEIDKAKESLLKSIKLNDNFWRSHFNLALIYWKLNEIDSTILEMQKVVDIDSDYIKYFYTDPQFKQIIEHEKFKSNFE